MAELERRIRREWIRYAILEASFVFLPFGIFLMLYIDSVSDRALKLVILGAVLIGLALVLTTLRRIHPLASELAELKKLEGIPSDHE